MPVQLIKEGPQFSIYAWGDDTYCELEVFLQELAQQSNSDVARLVYLINRTAEQGPPRNEQQCRPLKGKHAAGLFEFKVPHTARIIWFYDEGRIIVCTHGFTGKRGSGQTSKSEIEKAQKIRVTYLKEKKDASRK
jgi:hypothetical protein